MTARQVEARLAHDAPRARDQWGWNWSVVKQALEHLFWAGQVTSAGRNTQFERRYAVPERVLPREVVDAPALTEAAVVPRAGRDRRPGPRHRHRAGPARLLPARARRTPARRSPRSSRKASCTPVTVRGWSRAAYLHRDARIPRRVARPGTAQPVRLPGLAAGADRAPVRDGVPAGDLRTGASCGCTATTSCRSCSATPLVARVDLKADRAAAGGEGDAAGPRRRTPSPRHRRRPAAELGRGARRRWPAGSGSARWSSCPAAATWRRPGRCAAEPRSPPRSARPGQSGRDLAGQQVVAHQVVVARRRARGRPARSTPTSRKPAADGHPL